MREMKRKDKIGRRKKEGGRRKKEEGRKDLRNENAKEKDG
jgi:hypothetical protein